MNTNRAVLPGSLTRLRGLSLAGGLILALTALLLSLVFRDEGETAFDPFMQAFLIGFALWGGVSIGSLALLMIHHMTAGEWSFIIQRVLEASTRVFFLFVGGGLVLLLGSTWLGWHSLYEGWIHPQSHVVENKIFYLNLPFWTFRAFVYFAIFGGLIYCMNRWSWQLEQTGNTQRIVSLRKWSAPGIILYCLTMTFFATDYFMSLEPEWFSTIYGPLFWVSQGLTCLAVFILILQQLAQERPLVEHVTREHYYLLGTFMMAFMILWAYMSMSQYLIIWAGNLPVEISYYLVRQTPGWLFVAWMLMLLHFFLPLLILLQRQHVKYHINRLKYVCYFMLIMRVVDLFWFVNPAFHYGDSGIFVKDILMAVLLVLGLGGIWMFLFLTELPKRPLLPTRDPRLHDAIATIPPPHEQEPVHV